MNLVAARMEAAKRMRNELFLAPGKIAKIMKRNHSTITYYLNDKKREVKKAGHRDRWGRSIALRHLDDRSRQFVINGAVESGTTPELFIASLAREVAVARHPWIGTVDREAA